MRGLVLLFGNGRIEFIRYPIERIVEDSEQHRFSKGFEEDWPSRTLYEESIVRWTKMRPDEPGGLPSVPSRSN